MGELSESWNRLKSTRHAKYVCNYHFVWIPKYGRDVLDGLEEIARELGCEIIALHAELDHIHLFVSCPPATPRRI